MGPTQRVLSGFVKNPRHPNVRRGQTRQPQICIWRAKISLLRTKMSRDSILNVPKKKKRENDHSLHWNSRVSAAETYFDPAVWLNSTRHLKWFPPWEGRVCGRLRKCEQASHKPTSACVASATALGTSAILPSRGGTNRKGTRLLQGKEVWTNAMTIQCNCVSHDFPRRTLQLRRTKTAQASQRPTHPMGLLLPPQRIRSKAS